MSYRKHSRVCVHAMCASKQVILTKCDLVLRKDLVRRVTQVREQLNEVTPRETRMPVLMVSALYDKAVTDIQKELAGLAPQRSKPVTEETSDTVGSSNSAPSEASDAVEYSSSDHAPTKSRQYKQQSPHSSSSGSSHRSRSDSVAPQGRAAEQYTTKFTGARAADAKREQAAAAAQAEPRRSSKGFTGTKLLKFRKKLIKVKNVKRRR
jgi:hypothetical protein